jgi:hypothetical protein
VTRLIALSGTAAALLIAGLLLAQSASFDGRPALLLGNNKIELTVLTNGATLANLTLRDDAAKLSPFWNTDRALAPARPVPAKTAGLIGHFLCLDGFGAPSEQEKAAGWPFHGEASKQEFTVIPIPVANGVQTLKLSARLPLAQEVITRTMTLLEGENVVYVDTEVESLLAVDRPLSWAEHATVGPPFLSPGNTVIDLSGAKCRVRAQKSGSTGKLSYGKDFVWPVAPLTQGGTVDLTAVPAGKASLDLAACQVDPARTNGYITALRPDKHLIFGYIFHREEYPWVMSWMNYTGDARAARGFEFSTQPFDISHQETVDAHEMFGTPTYKWLPAKSKLHSRFLFFYASTPDGFNGVADVKLENGQIQILDRSGRTVTLKAKRSL